MPIDFAERRLTWLVAGALLGMTISYYCPAEPAYADTAAMGERFAMCTCNTIALNSEAVFVLDMVTGRLIGGGYATAAGGFAHSWYRDLAKDFRVTSKAQYVMCSGFANLQQQGGGGAQPGSGVIYVGELTSGLVYMYGFYYPQSNVALPPTELVPIGSFPWRQSSK
jgi:hypothetical protein